MTDCGDIICGAGEFCITQTACSNDTAAKNCYGEGVYDVNKGSCIHYFTTSEVAMWAVIAVVIALVTLAIGIYVARNVDKCKKIETEEDKLRKRLEKEKKLVLAEQLKINYRDPKNVLGEGAFGKVYQGKFLSLPEAKSYENNPKSVNLAEKDYVACKMVNDSKNAEILKEVDIMIELKATHEHVLGLKGLYLPKKKVVKKLQQDDCLRKPIIIMEKMKCSLSDYLKDTNNYLTVEHLLRFCRQILEGMQYLDDKEVVHRDLATRNILIDNNEVCLKVTDFGLSRKQEFKNDENSGGEVGVYQGTGQQKIAIPWNAIESLDPDHQEFSAKSDVWQCGVVFWEIFTLGRLIPFFGPEQSSRVNTAYQIYPQIRHFLEIGIRLNRPKFMAHKIFDLCLHCWDDDKNSRPTFRQLNDAILAYMTDPRLLNLLPNDSYDKNYLNTQVKFCILDQREYRLEPDKNRYPNSSDKPDYYIEQNKLAESYIFKYQLDPRQNKIWVRRTAMDLPEKISRVSSVRPNSQKSSRSVGPKESVGTTGIINRGFDSIKEEEVSIGYEIPGNSSSAGFVSINNQVEYEMPSSKLRPSKKSSKISKSEQISNDAVYNM